MTYMANLGQPVCLVGYIWYVEDTKKILVDSGGTVEQLTKNGLPAYELQTLDSGLKKLGITVNDIDLIIQTHLHLDHVALASRFPNAHVIVQKRELDFARNPHPIWEGLYDRKLFENLNFEVIDGDLRISEDINILFTPGHSPGGQSVSVKTETGTAVITGLCSILDNYNPSPLPDGKTIAALAPTIHSDLFQAYDSIARIKELADMILPIHDPTFLSKESIP